MKLWIDDLRTPPSDDWVWVKTSQEALDTLSDALGASVSLERISFDHDLGGDDTTRRVALWLVENHVLWDDAIVTVHSMNPIGVEWLTGLIDMYGPGVTRVYANTVL